MAQPRLKVEVGQPLSAIDPAVDGRMPSKQELDSMFRVLMESMNVSPDNERDLLSMSDERKWKLIRNDAQRRIAVPPDYFVTQLRRHLDPELRRKPTRKLLEGLEPSIELLRKLEVALRTNTASWVEEFVDHPNSGHMVLLEFMLDLPKAASANRALPVLQRVPGEHHLCIICFKALIKYEYAVHKILAEDVVLNKIALSLQNENARTRMSVLQILTTVAHDPADGRNAAVDAIHHLSCVARERGRFQTLVKYLDDASVSEEFALAALRFIASLVNTAPDLNHLVQLQVELAAVGFQEALVTLKRIENGVIRQMVEEYNAKIIDVSSLMTARDENYQLYSETLDQLTALHQTLESLSQQRDELRALHQGAQLKAVQYQETAEQYQHEIEVIQRKTEDMARQITDLKAANELLQQQQREAEDKTRFDDMMAVPPPAPPAPPAPVPYEIPQAPPMPGTAAAANFIPPAPPLPLPPGADAAGIPPAPAFMAGSDVPPPGVKPKRKIKPNVALPMLNWIPLRNIKDTIFEFIDDENVLNELDFLDFENEFRVKDVQPKKEENVAEKGKKKKAEAITIVEGNRAKNLIITVRRIGLDYEKLKTTILTTDLPILLAEHAELLLNYIPQSEELEALNKHKLHKDRLGEAERFLYETQQIDRYESRLRAMAYIGGFDDLFLIVEPQIEAVLKASEALATSPAFRKLLEIILAFGNYMNSAKRGAAYGFKLATFERLLDTKSSDRRQTLLHYITKVVDAHYPQVQRFTQDIQSVKDAAKVSSVTLATDVQGLRNGIDLILYEREKQPNNFVIFSFYNNAVHKVARVSEKFKLMEERYATVCRLFNENSKMMEPFDFFAVFSRFLLAYEKVREELKKTEPAPRATQQQVVVSLEEKFKSQRVQLPPHPILQTNNKLLKPRV